MLFKINVDTKNGGLQLDNDFLLDFGDEPGGPVLAHEVSQYLYIHFKVNGCCQNVMFIRECLNTLKN